MAYKIQVGAARLGGTLTQEGDIVASSSELSGNTVSASADVIAKSGMEVENGATISAGDDIRFQGASAAWLEIETDSNGGVVSFSSDLGSSTELARFSVDGSKNGQFSLAGTDNADIDVSCVAGVLSGSGDFELGGNLIIGGNLTIGGDLTVRGTNTILDVTTFSVADKIVQLASGSNTTGNNGGLAFGITGSNGAGAQFRLDTTQNPNRFEARDGNDNSDINISASVLYGDGSNLTGVNSSLVLDPGSAKVDGDTLDVGLNIVSNMAANVGLSLPSGSGLASGNEIIVKITSAVSDKKVTITRAGSDDIDGENSIVLESDHAAVRLVYDNSGSFKIF